MLTVNNLSIAVAGKTILKDLTFTLGAGDVMVLFGPNGSGKTSLIKTILGLGGYHATTGDIVYKNTRLNDLAIDERVRRGIGIMYQHPPRIRGVKLRQIAQFLNTDTAKITSLAQTLELTDHLNRDVNLDFSGGEMKRAELFQLLLQNPDLLLLDEPESGVDLENICLMGKILAEYLRQPGKSALIITHTGYILDYIASKHGCVLLDGKFWCVGDPKEMFATIRESGYEKCKVCQCPQKS